MSSKSKTYTLHSSGSLSKILKIPQTDFQKNVTSKLYLAKKKLLPIINDVMKTAKESDARKPFPLNKPYYLTVDQYKDAVWASQILKDVNEMFRKHKPRRPFSKSFKTHHFNLDHAKMQVNRYGKIFVDTPILVQLIELHNIFGEIIDYVQEVPSESPTNGLTDTEESLNRAKDDDSSKESKLEDILNDLEGSSNFTGKSDTSTKEILTSLTLPLHNNFVVMTARSSDTKNDLTTLQEEEASNSEVNLTDVTGKGTRKTKSSSFLMDDDKSLVTDAAGARRIIVRCMSDLDKVRHYLERDYVTGISSVDRGLDDDADHDRPVHDVHHDRKKELEDREDDKEDKEDREEDKEDQEDDKEDQEDDKEDEEDDEEDRKDEQDVTEDVTEDEPVNDEEQSDEPVVIDRKHDKKPKDPSKHLHLDPDDPRKCCCSEECPADQPLEFTWQENGDTSSKMIICIKGKSEEEGDVHIVIKQCPECRLYGGGPDHSEDAVGGGGHVKHENVTKEVIKDRSIVRDESVIKEVAKDRKVVRDGGHGGHAHKDKINFESAILHGKDPDDTCDVSSTEDMDGSDNINVIFNPNDPSSSVVEGVRKKTPKKKHDAHDPAEKMSTIKLNETINLNLKTDQGPELIISLTVRPKVHVPVLHLKDIFSESQTEIPERDGDQPEKDEAPKEVEEDDLGVPLSRTKVCSSLEFDVQTVQSRMKSSGIKHRNANITFKLNDLGVNNLLRASRPVKCGRKAILNETLMKCMPYSPSLKSLPLEDVDTHIIDQSLNMSMTRSKHSTIYLKDTKMSYTVEVSTNRNPGMGENHTKQVYFVHVPAPIIVMKDSRKKTLKCLLGFYINLENDIKLPIGSHIFEIRYFEIDNIKKDLCNKTDPPDTIFSVRLRNSRRSSQGTDDNRSSVGGSACEQLSNLRPGSSYNSPRFPSRIPIYKHRKSKDENERKGPFDVYDVSLVSLPKKGKNSKGFAVEFKNLVGPEKRANRNFTDHLQVSPSAIPLKQAKNKSLLTLKKVSQTNTIEIFPPNNFTSVESLEYFNSFLRNAAIFQNTTMYHERRKKREFYTSRSHSLLVMRASTENGHSGDSVKLTTVNEAGKKCIKHNDVILSATQFKKQLNSEKNVSKMLIHDLSTFIYENFVKDLSPEAKIEIFRRIDNFLSLHSRIKLKQTCGKGGSNEKGSW